MENEYNYMNVFWVDDAIPHEVCDAARKLLSTRTFLPGQIDDGFDTEQRSCMFQWVEGALGNRLNALLASAIHKANKRAQVELSHSVFEERLKYVRYFPDDHYMRWHADTGPGYAGRRKLSIIVGLNHPDEYEGGQIEIMPFDVEHSQLHNDRVLHKGGALIFPSFLSHRVTKVTAGERHILLNWATGPEWR